MYIPSGLIARASMVSSINTDTCSNCAVISYCVPFFVPLECKII
ncbi:hypothetical protein PH505_ab00630 [Pseudoalteromonas distincta]|nr:hypothetical protein PH505_ab00630 [Pseudoalteromonas distincta]